jgi:hypothetical protein
MRIGEKVALKGMACSLGILSKSLQEGMRFFADLYISLLVRRKNTKAPLEKLFNAECASISCAARAERLERGCRIFLTLLLFSH